MKALNHVQARQWIEATADGILKASQQEALQAHLLGCAECQAYAGELQLLEANVKRVMRLRWDGGGLPPHSIDRITRGTQEGLKGNGGAPTGTGRVLLSLIGLAALGLLGLGLYLGISSFRNYAAATTGGPGSSPATVFIQNPQPGSTFEVGSVVPVTVKASGPVALVGLELWADGELIGVQSAPTAQGVPSLEGEFDWQSDQPGTHTFLARAIDRTGQTATSSDVSIELVEKGEVPPGGIVTTIERPGPVDASPPLPPPGNDGPIYRPVEPPAGIPSGTPPEKLRPWSPTLGGWFTSMFDHPDLPVAPAIPATAVEGCAPRLWISDNSNNEAGFYVYRRQFGMANFAKIATLDAHVGAIFTYDDKNLFGIYSYYVSAFNSAGEAPGNIVRVKVDSPNCKPKPNPAVSLRFAGLPSAFPVDRGYCYVSFDGLDWSRFPSEPDEFLDLPPGGMGLQGPGELARFSREGAPATLDLECWAWGANGLQKLGRWHYDNLPPKPGPPPGGGGSGGGIGPEVGMADANVDPSLLYVKFDSRIPKVLPFATYSKQDCFDYIGIPNTFAAGLICGSVPDGQGMLAWNVNNKTCPAKVADPAAICFKPADIIGYNIYDNYPNKNAPPIAMVNAPSRLHIVTDWKVCLPRFERVSALVNVGGEILEGQPSAQVYFAPDPTCPYSTGQVPRMFRVTWNSIDFSVGDIDDGLDPGDDAEGYGYLTVSTSSSGFLRYFNISHQEFEDDADANPYLFASLLMEQHDSKCMSWPSPCWPGAALNNNSVDVPVYLGEGIRIFVDLMENDPSELPDDLCIQDNPGPQLNVTASMVDQAGGSLTVSRTSMTSSATCKVRFTVQALTP